MIVVGTTLCAFAMDDPDTWGAWLLNAKAMRDLAAAGESPMPHFFVAIEVDARGLAPFAPLVEAIRELGGDHWAFMLDDGRTEVTTNNRLRHICTGQNLVCDFATTVGASHLLFMAADTSCPVDTLPRLLEVEHPIVGGHVSTYGLSGPPAQKRVSEHLPPVDAYPAAWDVQVHMPTAAFVLIDRPTFKQLKWRWDADEAMSDDPAYHRDARVLLGIEAYVRHDVIGRHYPECIGPVETRGHDMRVVRPS